MGKTPLLNRITKIISEKGIGCREYQHVTNSNELAMEILKMLSESDSPNLMKKIKTEIMSADLYEKRSRYWEEDENHW